MIPPKSPSPKARGSPKARARIPGVRPPSALVGLSPWTDLTSSLRSYTTRAFDKASLRGCRVKVPAWQCPKSAPAAPQGAPGSSGWLGAPTGETGPLGAQPLPRVLEPAASKATHPPATDDSGAATRSSQTAARCSLQPHVIRPAAPRDPACNPTCPACNPMRTVCNPTRPACNPVGPACNPIR